MNCSALSAILATIVVVSAPIIGFYGAICLIILYFFYNFLITRWFLFSVVEKPNIKVYAKRKGIEEVLKASLDIGCVLVEGPSGSGKSTLCKQMAHELSKNYPVLFYTATNTDFESTLQKSVTGLLAPVVIWWNKLTNNSDIKQWFNSILVASKGMKEKPIIFIDAIDILENNSCTIKQLDGKESLLITLFNIAQSTTKARFVFITSDYGSHIIHRSSKYPLKDFTTVFVGEVTHNEAVEYLNSLKISTDIHSSIFEICGYLMEFLGYCGKLVKNGNVDMAFLRYCVEAHIRVRILRSGLETSSSDFIAFVKDLNASKNLEVDLSTLKSHFPEQSQIDNIIRGKALYISSANKVSFQSKGIYNYVVNEMKLTNQNQ
ncbi:hypothetical protein ABK040_003142 [Willaertia magna]